MDGGGFSVRQAHIDDVAEMAAVHVQSWRETYRGLMPDSVLDDPDSIDRRIRMWTTVVSETGRGHRAAVALHDGGVIGIAMTGPPLDEDATWERQLMVLYLLAQHQGSGIAVPLVNEVLDRATPAALWVADPNPRAQAFYEKVGFVRDGHAVTDAGVREVRMTRT
jgi:GNAT superfamily N-acetyltransferase